MPANTTILMCRHAEKPSVGVDLAIAGQERAQAYVVYFQNYSATSGLAPIEHLYAAADSAESSRPRLTIEPLSQALGITINCNYKDKHFASLAGEILNSPSYDNTTILICWHHGMILDLAESLGVSASQLPVDAKWPSSPWPEVVYGWLLQLRFDASGSIIPSQTFCINQELMYGDAGKNPPSLS